MTNKEYTLVDLIKQGGILYKVKGVNKKEILSNLIDALPDTVLSKDKNLSLDKKSALLEAVMEREALISTGIENGIALPHPRTLQSNIEEPFVVIAFPEQTIDWGTPDNKPVHTIFLIVSDSPKQHLNALTKINFLCMDNNFYNLIAAQTSKEEIIAAIEEAEKDWRK